MIPQSFIDAWRKSAPWSSDLHVEQDLVLARALASKIKNYIDKL